MPAVVTLTLNPSLDKASSLDALRPDSKLRLSAPTLSAGGGGLNVARALVSLGCPARAVYPAGGPAAALLQQALEEAGVSAQAVAVAAPLRECLNVHERSTGREYRLIMPGAALAHCEIDTVLQALADLSGYRYLVISGSLPAGCDAAVVVRAMRLAKHAGARCVLDLPGNVLAAVLAEESAYLIKPNVHELADLLGVPSVPIEQAGLAAQQLVVRGLAQLVLVSCGASGAAWASPWGVDSQQAPAVASISSVGAGDSLVAGFIAAALSKPPSDAVSVRAAVLYGMAAGTAATLTPSDRLCEAATVEQLFRELKQPS